MKVKDLMEELQKMKPDSDVYFQMQSGCCGEVEVLVPLEDPFDDYHYKDESSITISFYPLPGYKSCRQAADTLKKDEEYWSEEE